MNHENAERSIMLTLAAGRTPVVVGDRGIGKTCMMKSISKKLDMKLITVDCNLLKEGEIGGLPIPSKNDKGIMITEYAIHAKLKQIEDYLEANPDGSILLFFDEINRTTRETMAELMNLILNKNINGYNLPESVFIVAAMNPSSTTSGFEGNSSYGVTDMDAASKNRLVWLYLELDTKSWLSWATDKPFEMVKLEDDLEVDLAMYDAKQYECAIDTRVIEFIASNPQMLNIPNENTDVSPSGRTWEFASDILRTFEINKGTFNTNHLDACIKGCIGSESYISLMNFLNNNQNPLITAEQFFANKEIKQELLERFGNDTLPRQMIMAKNIARFLSDKKRLLAPEIERLAVIYDLIPIDVLLITMRFIKETFPPLHKKLLDNTNYLILYKNATKLAS